MSKKLLVIGIIVLIALILFLLFYKKNSSGKRNIVANAPVDQEFLGNIDYYVDINNYIETITVNPSIKAVPDPCRINNTSRCNNEFKKITDEDYTSGITFIKSNNNTYIMNVIFSEFIYLRRLRIFTGYGSGPDWTKVKIESCEKSGNQCSSVDQDFGEFSNTVVRNLDFTYFDFTEIIFDKSKDTTFIRLTFTSEEPLFIRKLVFLGYTRLSNKINEELASVDINGFKITPLINQIPLPLSRMFNNNYANVTTYNELLPYKETNTSISKEVIKLDIPFDKIYSFYQLIIYYKITKKDDIGFKILSVSGYNDTNSSFIDTIYAGEIKDYYFKVYRFSPIRDNRLILEFIDPNANLAIRNIDCYGVEVYLSHYDQILISNPKQQNISLSEIQVFNEKFENILPSSIEEGKAVVLQTPSNSDLVSRIEIIKDVETLEEPFIPNDNYVANYETTLIIAGTNTYTLNGQTVNEIVQCPFYPQDLSNNFLYLPKNFKKLKKMTITAIQTESDFSGPGLSRSEIEKLWLENGNPYRLLNVFDVSNTILGEITINKEDFKYCCENKKFNFTTDRWPPEIVGFGGNEFYDACVRVSNGGGDRLDKETYIDNYLHDYCVPCFKLTPGSSGGNILNEYGTFALTRNIDHVYYNVTKDYTDIFKNIDSKKYPIRFNRIWNTQRYTKIIIRMEYYFDYRVLIQINELSVFSFNKDRVSSLLPKYNDDKKINNYKILTNGIKILSADNMLIRTNTVSFGPEEYYKSRTINGRIQPKITIYSSTRTEYKEFRIQFRPNQKFNVNPYIDTHTGQLIRDKYEMKVQIYGELIEQYGSSSLRATKHFYLTRDQIVQGNTFVININNLINDFYGPNYMSNKTFKFSKIEITFDGISGTYFLESHGLYLEDSEIEINRITFYDKFGNLVNDNSNLFIQANTTNTDGSIEKLYDNNVNTYFRNDKSPFKLFMLFDMPIPLDKIILVNAPSGLYRDNIKGMIVNFYNFKNNIIQSYKITEVKDRYEFKMFDKITDSYNIINLYDNNLNTYSATFPEIEKYRQDISGLKILGPYILIFFNSPVLLTGIKINNVSSIFLNYKGEAQGDNSINGLLVNAALGPRWTKPNSKTVFKCFGVEDTYTYYGRTYTYTKNANAYRINEDGNSECYSKYGNECDKWGSIPDCERDMLIDVPGNHKECGTGSDDKKEDCLFYQKYVKDNKLCLRVNNNNYIKILNQYDSNGNKSFGCKVNPQLDPSLLLSDNLTTSISETKIFTSNNDISYPNFETLLLDTINIPQYSLYKNFKVSYDIDFYQSNTINNIVQVFINIKHNNNIIKEVEIWNDKTWITSLAPGGQYYQRYNTYKRGDFTVPELSTTNYSLRTLTLNLVVKRYTTTQVINVRTLEVSFDYYNSCLEYTSRESCNNDTITSSDLLICADNMKNNPNHWCSKASSELFNNQYKRYASVGGISGELFPMYCKIDENVEKYPCQTQLVLENNFTNTNELVYEGPSKNVYIGRISSVPYDPSGNIPYTSTSSPIKTSITSFYQSQKIITNYSLIGSTGTINLNNYFNVPNSDNITSLKLYCRFKLTLSSISCSDTGGGGDGGSGGGGGDGGGGGGGPVVLSTLNNSCERIVKIYFKLKDGNNIIINSMISSTPYEAYNFTTQTINISNPNVLLSYKNKSLSLEVSFSQDINDSLLTVSFNDFYYDMNYDTMYNEPDKYSTQIVNNSNYLNCEEVARLISSNKNWDINNVDYNGKKIVFTSQCS
jgi:hypothetical protein